MESIKRQFCKYVGLNVLGMLGISCYILADTFFVAKALGAEGIAALNLALAVFSVLQGVGLMLGIGGASLFSLHQGQGDEAGGRAALLHSLVLGGLAAAVFLTVAVFFVTPLATALGADSSTLPLTKSYLQTLLAFSPCFLANNILLAFVRNDKNPRLSMAAMLLSSLSNIFLDYLFMFPMGMGMFGAALATGLSPAISIAVLSLHLRRRGRTLALARCPLKRKSFAQVLALGLSSLVGELASAVSLVSFNLVMLRLAGNIGVAAYGIVANLALIATAVFVGVAQGIQPLVSACYGRGETAAVRSLGRSALGTALVLAMGLSGLVILLAEPLVAVFNGAGDKALAALATQGLRLYFPGYFFAGINVVAAAFLSAVSHPGRAMAIALLRSCVLLVPLVLVLAELLGQRGVWLAFVVTEGLVCLVTAASLRSVGMKAAPDLEKKTGQQF